MSLVPSLGLYGHYIELTGILFQKVVIIQKHIYSESIDTLFVLGGGHDLGHCDNGRGCQQPKQLRRPLRVEATYLPSDNPHCLEGCGTISLSLETINIDMYPSKGHVFFVLVTHL